MLQGAGRMCCLTPGIVIHLTTALSCLNGRFRRKQVESQGILRHTAAVRHVLPLTIFRQVNAVVDNFASGVILFSQMRRDYQWHVPVKAVSADFAPQLDFDAESEVKSKTVEDRIVGMRRNEVDGPRLAILHVSDGEGKVTAPIVNVLHLNTSPISRYFYSTTWLS